MSQVLIADNPEDAVSLTRILSGHQLVVVHTMEAASVRLHAQTFDLIVIGLHFDDSQMFELIREAKTIPANAGKPIICFCSRNTKMARIMHESLVVTTSVLGAWMYLNEHAYNVYQNPDAELRRVIDRCLTDEARKEIQLQRVDVQKQRAELQHLRTMLQSQEWSPELRDYLKGLRHDLELLLQDVTTLQSSAEHRRAVVESSRGFNDRVSEQVTMNENGMTRLEGVQLLDEARQSTDEDELMVREEAQESEGQRKRADNLLNY
jgi:CheY-like chemotaxis protein